MSFLAPALIGLFTALLGSDRAGTIGIVLVLLAGLVALLPVRTPIPVGSRPRCDGPGNRQMNTRDSCRE